MGSLRIAVAECKHKEFDRQVKNSLFIDWMTTIW